MYTLHITGVALSRGDDAYLGTELDQCPYNRNHFWCSSLGQWQEIFICNLVHTFLRYFCMCATGKSVLSPAIHINVNMLIRFRYILIHFFMFPGQHLLALPMVQEPQLPQALQFQWLHSINNIIGGLLWRITKNSQK